MVVSTEKREVLPTNVKPTHYSLQLEPNLTTFATDGCVTIELDVYEDSTEISLNMFEIEVLSVGLQRTPSKAEEEKPITIKFAGRFPHFT